MEFFTAAIDFLLHLDTHLAEVVSASGGWVYLILFVVVFAETGFVVTPFLPGDSLLFAIGSLCALGMLQIELAIALLIVAAIGGDAVNYTIGNRFGHYILSHPRWQRWVRKEHVDRTHAFFARHGGKTIILARFVPIVRTFAPFLAGLGEMAYPRFALYNIVGALLWVISFTLLGYLFGNMPFVKHNFSTIIAGIIGISMLPGLIEAIRYRRRSPAQTQIPS
ncbi:MAG: DedA family protein [Bacteroidota bacterium]|nr:DedA family protein [Candidatus Kapabacteria bacterium]MCS7302027.1 DedA family protein [Candidatus Kapabacteria bacterium]MCX7936827.1 DedA family protein [Chlorobiota bacterium]MDW8074546.1 DedA family protein [Bacteroidota bacterium]MDW8270978.1 DedA family protein [Bacteroidota bacterium]